MKIWVFRIHSNQGFLGPCPDDRAQINYTRWPNGNLCIQGPERTININRPKDLVTKTNMLDNFCFFLPNKLKTIRKSRTNHQTTNQKREGWGPLGPPGSPLSLLVGFLMVFVDVLMIFKVFGKKIKVVKHFWFFFTKSVGFFMFVVLSGS